jgi:tetratricopeptide (TPR) repeat protein
MRFVVSAILLLLSTSASPAFSQIPEKFENLRVLPKDVDRRALIETMRGFSFALGVRCEHCHVGGPALDSMSFASDEKQAKRTARTMLEMVRAINEEHLAKIEGRHELDVSCFTCHHGVARPEPLENVVEEAIASSGLEAASNRYRELRGEYFGSAAYDFGVGPLNRVAEKLMEAGNAEAAVAVLRLNAEFHPDSAWLHYLLGEAYLQSGDRERARASYERSLELDGENPRVKQRLEELRQEKRK